MAGVAAGGGGKVVTGDDADFGEYNIAVMVVLAIETVTPLGSVAVWRDGMCVSRTGDGATPHGTRLPGAWMSAVADANLRLDQIDRLAVVAGPGSFTGMRIGLASAPGLALTRGWQVPPLPTLDAMAECWRHAHQGSPARVVVACLDGLRGEIFAREYHFDGVVMDAHGEAVVGTPDALAWTAFGEGVTLVGSGAVKHQEVLRTRAQGAADHITEVPESIAAGAARLAATGAMPEVLPHALRPLYVRRPDVELARERGRTNVC